MSISEESELFLRGTEHFNDFLEGAQGDEHLTDASLVGSKSVNSAKLLNLVSQSNGLFEAPRQCVIPNYILQEIMKDIKMSYIEQLN